MAITTYAQLKTAVADWLNRSDLTSVIPDFIALCESEFNARLRLLQMEYLVDLTINAETVAQPSGWIASKRLYLDGTPRYGDLVFLPPSQIDDAYPAYTGASRPLAYTIEGSNFRFLPGVGSGWTGKLLYYKRFDALSADADTNYVLTSFPGIYLYGSLKQAAPYLGQDERIALWQGLYEQHIVNCEANDTRARYSGGTPRAIPTAVV